MVFNGSANVERIFFSVNGKTHWIDMAIHHDEPVFSVTCCCDEEWEYDFFYSPSDYSRIKFNIMNAIFENESIDDALCSLDDIFCDGFSDILLGDDDEPCDGDCEHCDCNADEYVPESKHLN